MNITLNSQGAKAFADASRDLVADHGKIVIILDGEVQSAPAVQSEIPNGEVSITGQYSLEDAKALQTILESGSLPVSFEYAQSQVVGPTLGQDALVSGVVVALIGLALVMLYLLFFYKGLGIITAAAMGVFAVLYLGILAALSAFHLFSLSLAGIAGIVLTIGMAADSSILTVERFREEIRMGRSVKAASITGVKHAIFTSIDADLVTMVSALCLFFLAAASVKGFGMTLALGIICDIAMMLIFKAPLIRLLAPKVIAKHPGFWGIKDSIDASKGYAELAAAEGVPEAEAEDGAQMNAAETRVIAEGEGEPGSVAVTAVRKIQRPLHQARHQLPRLPQGVPHRGRRGHGGLPCHRGLPRPELRHRVRRRHVGGLPRHRRHHHRADARGLQRRRRARRRHPDHRDQRRARLPRAHHDHLGRGRHGPRQPGGRGPRHDRRATSKSPPSVPDWGASVIQSSLIAFLVSILLIIVYIAIRFEYKMGVMAIVALFHDLILVVGIYALVGREVNPNTIAALLTILGYSLYDTVVVFHRINDNMKGEDIRCTFMTMANHSMNQVFIRTINTTLTSFIPVFAMLLFGGETLKDFAFAMAIGLIAGSYSSIAIACPLYCMWKTREPKFAKLQKKYGTEVGLFEFDHSASTGIAQVPLARLEANARAEAYVAEQKEATGEAPDAAAVAAAAKPKPVNNKKKKHRHGRAQ